MSWHKARRPRWRFRPAPSARFTSGIDLPRHGGPRTPNTEQGDAAARVASRPDAGRSPTKPGGIAHPGRVAGVARVALAVDLDVVRLDLVDHQFNHFGRGPPTDFVAIPLRRGSRSGCRGTSRPLEPSRRLGGVGGQRGNNQGRENRPEPAARDRCVAKTAQDAHHQYSFEPIEDFRQSRSSAALKGIPRGRGAGRHGVGMLTNRLGVNPTITRPAYSSPEASATFRAECRRCGWADGLAQGTAKRMIIGVHQ